METPIVLAYWNIRGMAERCRHLLEYCGVPYTQVIYTPETADKWFKEDKPKLIEKNPAITLPYLIDGDKVISESDAILIYICHKSKKVELLGRNIDEWIQTATVWGVFKDAYRNYAQLCYSKYESEEAFQEAVKKSSVDWAPALAKLNGLLGEKQYIGGDITWVDFGVADFLQILSLLSGDYLKDFPKLSEYQKRIWSLPQLKGYFADRFKERPINGPSAHWK